MVGVSTRDGMRLHLEEDGAGVPVLLVHGFTGNSAAWGAELKGSLSRRVRSVSVDLLGHGASDKPEDPKRYALDEMVDDLCQVLDARQIARAVWVGYSMGGRIALAAAVRRPERVRALVLEGASPGLEQAQERAQRVADDERLARMLDDDGIESFVTHWMSLPLFQTQRQLGPERLAAERSRRLQNSARALAACLRGLGLGAQPSLWPELPEVRVPTLLIVGERDPKFRGIAARMESAMPLARTQLLPRAGHATHLERPTLYAEAVGRFCTQTSEDRGGARDEGRMDLGT